MSAYLDWKAGDKLVCVASPECIAMHMRALRGSKYPVANGIYTIREMRDDTLHHGDGISVLLVEIDNSHLIGTRPKPGQYFFVEPGFNPIGFRPVAKRTTSIEVFRALLNPTPDEIFRELEAAEFDYEPVEVPFR